MRRLQCFLWCAGLLACQDPERLEGHFQDQQAVTGLDADVLTLEPGQTVVDIHSIEGTWALFLQDRQCMHSVGTITESIIWSWYLLDVHEDADSVGNFNASFVAQTRVCHEELSPLVLSLTTMVPDIIPAAQPVRESTGYFLSTEQDGGFVLSEIVEKWGVPGISIDEEMPSKPDDQRVVDQDRDGYPGVTFGVYNVLGKLACEVRVVQRKRLRIRGHVVNSARVEGELWSRIDKVVLESTQALCESNAEFKVSPNGSHFVMVRVDGREGGYNFDFDEDGAVTCEELNDNLELFMSSHQLVLPKPDNESCRAAE